MSRFNSAHTHSCALNLAEPELFAFCTPYAWVCSGLVSQSQLRYSLQLWSENRIRLHRVAALLNGDKK